MASLQPVVTTPDSRRTPWRTDLAAVMATVVCAVIAWVFVVKLPGVDLSVLLAGERRHIGLSDIVIAATVCSAAGVILLRVLERRVKNPLRLWSVIAVLAVSYTHLDVYKRQPLGWGASESSVARCPPSKHPQDPPTPSS